MSEALERRMAEFRAIVEDLAVAEAELVQLSEGRKQSKARLMIAAEQAGTKTLAAQERDAYASPEYAVVVDGLVAATEKATRLRWLLRVAQMGVEAWRTQQANQRVERKGYGA